MILLFGFASFNLYCNNPIYEWDEAVQNADLVVEGEILNVTNAFEDIYIAKLKVTKTLKGRLGNRDEIKIYYRYAENVRLNLPILEVGKKYVICLKWKDLLNDQVLSVGFTNDYRVLD
jgi:hypothetical protein